MDCTKGCFSGFDLCCCNQSGGPGISADFADTNEDFIYGEFCRNPASFIADGSDFVCNVFDSDRM